VSGPLSQSDAETSFGNSGKVEARPHSDGTKGPFPSSAAPWLERAHRRLDFLPAFIEHRNGARIVEKSRRKRKAEAHQLQTRRRNPWLQSHRDLQR
jgi:hypothetical protein